ncbi:MAG: glycogen debranching protein GlgX [Rhizobiaceae bacterium]|nr:glycogen debranching protein GlgX [Rhizobiaceae bacterium]
MGPTPYDDSIIQGAVVEDDGTRFTVWSEAAETVFLCLFDGEEESARIALGRGEDGFHSAFVNGVGSGTRYGLRAEGPYDPSAGLWFDPDKLLVDPYAVELDRAFRYDAALGARRGEGGDTAKLMPKAVVNAALPIAPAKPPLWRDGGLVYELSTRAFTMLHQSIPADKRGTISALGEPAIIDHLTRLGVTAVELMPIVAWIDERHLLPLGLNNAWGYNPVTFMALDPRLAPGGIAELAHAVERLHEAGIGVILDVVFNHTGESDRQGPTLSLRGLDNQAYFRHREGDGGLHLVNDTGTGNTLACDHVAVQRLVLDSLRHFVRHAGIDGFRFDLAPILGRTDDGFDPRAEMLRRMVSDPILADRVLIAEPWDIGPDGYQLGSFPVPFLEWNDRYRDDVRRFWRGDPGSLGALATRLAGSADIFEASPQSRTVNFIAAHDGMTLADLTAYEHKHNQANGEDNRDGHGENFSWNNGVEGESTNASVIAARLGDIRALLATLFVSRSAIMLTAGDEFGRTQQGNNNAYAQDNEITWLDWESRDRVTEDFVAALAALRSEFAPLRDNAFLTGLPEDDPDVEWLHPQGRPMQIGDWEEPDARRLTMLLRLGGDALAVMINGSDEKSKFGLPAGLGNTKAAVPGAGGEVRDGRIVVAARSVALRRSLPD